MYCAKCGNLLPEDGKFCPVCGSPIVKEAVQPAPQPVAPQPVMQAAPEPVAPQPAMQAAPQPVIQAAPEPVASQPVPQPAIQAAPEPVAPQPLASQAAPQPAIQAVPQQYPGAVYPQNGAVPGSEAPVKQKKAKKWVIPVVILAVLVIGLVVFQFIYISRPAYKVSKAISKTFEPDGLIKALGCLNTSGMDSVSIEAEMKIGMGNDVDSLGGTEISGDKKPTINSKFYKDDESKSRRVDFSIDLSPVKDLELKSNLYINEKEVVFALPEILTRNVSFSFTEDKDGYIKNKLGEYYDLLRSSLEQAVKDENSIDYEEVGKEIVALFWNMLSEVGYEPINPLDLEKGETGYVVSVPCDRIAMLIDQSLDVILEAVKKANAEEAANALINRVTGSRMTIEDYFEDLSGKMHKKLDEDENNLEFYFAINGGTISNIRIIQQNARREMFEFLGNTGDYPLQNCVFLVNGSGIGLKGKTRPDGVEKCSLFKAVKNGNRSVRASEDEDGLSWTYNKDKKTFTLEIGDCDSGYHIRSYNGKHVSGISIKGTIVDSSDVKKIDFNKISFYDDGSEVVAIEGFLAVKEENADPIRGEKIDLNGMTEDELKALVEDAFKNATELFGSDISFINSYISRASGYNNVYDYDGYDNDYYDDYDDYYDDYYDYYDDYDYYDYDDYYYIY